MAKYPPNRQPDPNPMSVPARAASHRHEASRPTPSMPVVRWLDREVGEEQPRGGAGSGQGFDLWEGELGREPGVDKTHQRRNFERAQRVDKTGKYTNMRRVTLTDEQLALVEQAVKLSGKHFTEWARDELLVVAARQIREHSARKLDAAE